MKVPELTPPKLKLNLTLIPKILLLLFCCGAFQAAKAQTHALTNIWSMPPTTTTFMNTTNHLTRGLAYNPVSGHVLVVSRSPIPTAADTNSIYILDSSTGSVLGELAMDTTTLMTNGTFLINMIGVADDGAIYACNLTTDATNNATATSPGAFRLYRWQNESAMPTVAFSGDPSLLDTNANARRFGDSIAVRGAGANTQILLGTLVTNVSLLTTTDGVNFTAKRITTDGEASDTRWGIAWGAGNTFWAKQGTKNLKRLSLNIAAGTATVTASIPLLASPGGGTIATGGPLDVDLTRNLIALIDTTNHKLRVYDISDPLNPVQTDGTKDMPAANANGNNVGAVAMKNGLLFALETNNGIRAYTLHGGITYPPQVVVHPATVPTLWDGANWTHTVGVYGTRPLTYQWQLNGVDLVGKTQSSLLLPSVTAEDVGSYRVVVANVSGSVTSNPTMLGTPTHGNRTAQATNLWSILPYERPYLTTNHNEYGLAINPVNNNVLLLTRGMPTNMMVILDPLTGAQKHYIDWSDLLPLPGNSGYNKVDISDDGIIYLCNLTYNTTNTPFRIDALSDDGTANAGKPAFAGRSLYIGDPGNGKTQSNVVWGIAMAVRGSRPNVEILLGSGSYDQSSKTFAILREQGDGSFLSTAITVTNAPDKFARLGIDFGPEPNTIWGKTVGNLVLVQYDLATETGWVKKTYPTTGTRSVAYSVTGIRYDKNYNLLAGIQNGAPPSPVSVPIYNVANLEAGPLWVDQELYTTYNNEVNFQGNVDFANGYLVAMGGNNGLKGFQINPGFVPLPIILTHPVGGTWFENASSPTIQVVADATASISYQWYKETEPLVGRTQSSLTLTNIQLTDAGDYWVRVSTAGGSVDSDAATMEVLPYNNTAQMTTLWTALPLTQTYLNTKYYEYGMSFNPVNSNLLVASFIPLADNPTNPTPAIIGVLDGLTGTHKRVLNTTSITNGGNRWVNKIGVANDGVVYVGNRTTTPGSVNFVLYRYANDEAETVAGIAYKGDPFATMYNGTSKNVGFTMDVRGAGVNTEVLLSTGGTNLLSILSTTDGTNFTAKEYHVPGAARNFARLGVCFGPGNTIWTKAWGGDGGIMHLVGYNPSAGTASVLQTYTEMPYEMTTLAYNDSLKLLGAISRDSHKNLQLYSVVDQEVGPMLVDQEVFPTYNASIEANGALDFGGNTYLFGLNENNGIMAMLINPTYAPPTVVTATVDNGVVTLSWPAVNGGSYQVQYKSALDGTWQNLGSAISATSTTATFSENVAVGPRFYRVESLNP